MSTIIDNNSPVLPVDPFQNNPPADVIEEQSFELAKADPKPKQSRWKKLILPVAIVGAVAGIAYYFWRSDPFSGGIFSEKPIPCGYDVQTSIVGNRFPKVACIESNMGHAVWRKYKGEGRDWKKIDEETSALYQRCLAGNIPLQIEHFDGDYLYEGGLEKGAANGEGTLTGYDKETQAVKSVYKGFFKDGFGEGAGIYTKGNIKFVGNFLKGKFSGPGFYEDSEKRIEGTFDNDQLIDKAKMTIGKDESFDLTFDKPNHLVSANYHTPSGKVYSLDVRTESSGGITKEALDSLFETAKLIHKDMPLFDRVFGNSDYEIASKLLRMNDFRFLR